MSTNFEMVGQFHKTFKTPMNSVPTLIEDPKLVALRLSLIDEERGELDDGLRNKDIVEIADALTDILYVVYGMGQLYGIPLDECFEEVHRSNMSKLDENGNPIFREDGKIMKSALYSKPDLRKIIEAKLGKELPQITENPTKA
jgi:predicted HAD superfamily Cof-like phosphohydrolase